MLYQQTLGETRFGLTNTHGHEMDSQGQEKCRILKNSQRSEGMALGFHHTRNGDRAPFFINKEQCGPRGM